MASVADIQAAAPSFDLAWKDSRPRWRVDGVRQTGDGTCTFWCKLSDLDAALDAMEGVAEDVTLSTSPLITVTRYVPLVHPYEPRLYMTGYDIELYFSVEANDPAIRETGDQAKINVQFGLPAFAFSGEPYQRVSVRGTETHEAVDGATFAGGGTPSFEPTLILPGMSYGVTVYDAPAMDEAHEAYLRAYAGRVNLNTFRGNAPGTVRYHSPQIDYTRKRDGTRTATYSLQFDAKPRPWNEELRRNGTLAELLVGGAVRFLPLDFNSLFV